MLVPPPVPDSSVFLSNSSCSIRGQLCWGGGMDCSWIQWNKVFLSWIVLNPISLLYHIWTWNWISTWLSHVIWLIVYTFLTSSIILKTFFEIFTDFYKVNMIITYFFNNTYWTEANYYYFFMWKKYIKYFKSYTFEEHLFVHILANIVLHCIVNIL